MFPIPIPRLIVSARTARLGDISTRHRWGPDASHGVIGYVSDTKRVPRFLRRDRLAGEIACDGGAPARFVLVAASTLSSGSGRTIGVSEPNKSSSPGRHPLSISDRNEDALQAVGHRTDQRPRCPSTGGRAERSRRHPNGKPSDVRSVDQFRVLDSVFRRSDRSPVGIKLRRLAATFSTASSTARTAASPIAWVASGRPAPVVRRAEMISSRVTIGLPHGMPSRKSARRTVRASTLCGC